MFIYLCFHLLKVTANLIFGVIHEFPRDKEYPIIIAQDSTDMVKSNLRSSVYLKKENGKLNPISEYILKNTIYDLYPEFCELVKDTIDSECKKEEKKMNLQFRLESTLNYACYKNQLRYLFDIYDFKFDSVSEQSDNDVGVDFYKSKSNRAKLINKFIEKYISLIFKKNNNS